MKLFLIAALLALGGCVSQSTKQLCTTTSEITLTDAEIDALTPQTAREILAFNKTRRALCQKTL